MEPDKLDLSLLAQTTIFDGDERTPEQRGNDACQALDAAKGTNSLTREQAEYLLDMRSIVDEQEDARQMESTARMDLHGYENIHAAQRAGLKELVLDGSEGESVGENEAAASE